MDFYVAHGTILACLQIFHNAAFTDCGEERLGEAAEILSDSDKLMDTHMCADTR